MVPFHLTDDARRQFTARGATMKMVSSYLRCATLRQRLSDV